MKKFSCIALAVSLALSLLAGCSPSSTPPAAPAASGAPSSGTPAAPGKVYEIKLVTSNPSTDPTSTPRRSKTAPTAVWRFRSIPAARF